MPVDTRRVNLHSCFDSLVIMFLFIRIRRARTIVEQIGVNLDQGLIAMSPAERSATLAIANAMLLAASKKWGKGILTAPQNTMRKVAVDIIFDLAAVHSTIINSDISEFNHRGVQDISFSQALRQVKATEIVLATIGCAIVPETKNRVIPAWKTLYNARTHAKDALKLLIQYGKFAKTSPLPSVPGMKIDSQKVLQLATSAPPFLRPKKPATKKINPRTRQIRK